MAKCCRNMCESFMFYMKQSCYFVKVSQSKYPSPSLVVLFCFVFLCVFFVKQKLAFYSGLPSLKKLVRVPLSILSISQCFKGNFNKELTTIVFQRKTFINVLFCYVKTYQIYIK